MATQSPDGPEPTDDPNLEYDDSLNADLNVAARALVLGAALHDPDAIDGLVEDVPALGLQDLPPAIDDSGRSALLRASDGRLAEYGLTQAVARFERTPRAFVGASFPRRPAGAALWAQAANGDPVAAMAWLRATQATSIGLRQAAAAAALQPTVNIDPLMDGQHRALAAQQARAYRTDTASRRILRQFADPNRVPLTGTTEPRGALAAPTLTRELATAALNPHTLTSPASAPPTVEPLDNDAEDRADGLDRVGPVSVLVHGTAAYAGAWWRPRGDFHDYLRATISPDLYAEGQFFRWSGAYSAKHRDVAARDLCDWANPYGRRLHRVYAHSYGGVIALRALGLGLEVDDLILLSTPRENVETDYSRAGRVMSLRIHLDLILIAARRRQTFDLPVADFHLPRWFVGHGDTHEPDMWRKHEIARALNLT